MLSRFTLSVSSPHKCTSPPMIKCFCSSGISAKGSKDSTYRQFLYGAHQSRYGRLIGLSGFAGSGSMKEPKLQSRYHSSHGPKRVRWPFATTLASEVLERQVWTTVEAGNLRSHSRSMSSQTMVVKEWFLTNESTYSMSF